MLTGALLTDMTSELPCPLPHMYCWWWELRNVEEYGLRANRLNAIKSPIVYLIAGS